MHVGKEDEAAHRRRAAAAEQYRRACERYDWSLDHYQRARQRRLLTMQAIWRYRSKRYDRFGPVLAMARDAPPVRVLIVDEDVPSRTGVRIILSAADDMVVVGEASSGPDAVAQALVHQPDVIVMGILLPGMDGITTTHHIVSSEDLRAKVVILTTLDFDEYAYRARRAGASYFLSKRGTPAALVAAVRAAASGAAAAPYGEPRVAATLSFTPSLTGRERDVLYLVAEGLSNRDIAERLFVSVDTIKSHLKRVYAKCGVRDRPHLAAAAQANGFARLGATDDHDQDRAVPAGLTGAGQHRAGSAPESSEPLPSRSRPRR